MSAKKTKLRHSAKTTDVLASGYRQKGQDSSAAEPGNCTNMTPRPSEIRPVMSTQTAETRNMCRRDECDSREPPTPVRIMIGAVPAPKASIGVRKRDRGREAGQGSGSGTGSGSR